MDVRTSKQAGAAQNALDTKCEDLEHYHGCDNHDSSLHALGSMDGLTVAIACPPASSTSNNRSAAVAERMLGCAHKCKAVLTELETGDREWQPIALIGALQLVVAFGENGGLEDCLQVLTDGREVG